MRKVKDSTSKEYNTLLEMQGKLLEKELELKTLQNLSKEPKDLELKVASVVLAIGCLRLNIEKLQGNG